MIFRAFMAMVGCVLAIPAGFAVTESIQARSWPVAHASTTPSSLYYFTMADDGSLGLYYFTVDGRLYHGDRVSSFDLGRSCLQCIGIASDASSFPVRYSPGDPARSLITTSIPWIAAGSVGGVGLFFIGLALFWRQFLEMVMRQIAPDKVFNGPAPG